MYKPPSNKKIIIPMPTTIQLLIELESDSQPIAGTIRQPPDRRATAFAGWLQLTEIIEAARRSADQDPPTRPSATPNRGRP
jgi:hypothetical protein